MPQEPLEQSSSVNKPESDQSGLEESTISLQESVSLGYIGPLPLPGMMAEYDRIIPNGAERIMVMAEEQLKARISNENYALREEFKQGMYGQSYAFAVSLVIIAAATFLAINGHESIATVMVSLDIVGLVTAFIVGSKTSPTQKNTSSGDDE